MQIRLDLCRLAPVLLLLGGVAVSAQTRAVSSLPGEKDTAQATLVTYVAPATTTPKAPASIVVEVTPKPGMHVYAPGQEGFIPVSLTIEPHPGIKTGTAKLPKPKEMSFGTNDKALVYERPFRLEVPLTIAASTATAATLKGTFEYQACDDSICYKPVRVPLTWTLPGAAK